jgi:hypothetical protein
MLSHVHPLPKDDSSPMSLRTDFISLKKIEIRDDGMLYHYEAGGILSRFLSGEPLWVHYEGLMQDVPPGITAIPFVGLTAPMAWFFGGTLDVPELDALYAGGLDAVKSAYQRIYPDLRLSGHVNVGSTANISPRGQGRAAMLFSGGIDSSTTLISRRQEHPLLISLRGAEVRIHHTKTWQCLNRQQEATADMFGLHRTVVASNFLDILQQWALNLYFPGVLSRGWYVEIAFGQIFLGLCAPVTWREGVDRLYIASAHSPESCVRAGSCFLLDEATLWSGTRVVHDGFQETRQRKVERLAAAVREGSSGMVFLVCSHLGDESDRQNCCFCEKCSRSIAALVLEGLDPSQHGFRLDTDTPARIRRTLELMQWELNSAIFWQEMQQRIPQRRDTIPEAWRDFFKWLEGVNLESLVSTRRTSSLEKLRDRIKKALPYALFAILRHWKRRFFGPRDDL